MSIRTLAYGDHDEKVTYVGLTLCEREENYYDDSDGYSHVYDTDEHVIRRIGTWTTRAQSMTQPGVVDAYDEDAPWYDEMRQAHIDALIKMWFLDQKHQMTSDTTHAWDINKGDYVVVVKGRKVPKGTEGVVFWMKEANYGYYDTDKYRIGIDTGDGNVEWTYADNVVKMDPDLPHPEDYIGEVEMREKLGDLTLKQLHGTLCQYSSRLAYVR